MGTYRQYCPIARASEIMAERWTPLLVRNLMLGAHSFTDIARGVPAMSRSMLTKRLRELEHVGVIRSQPKEHGSGSSYWLTEAGADLASRDPFIGRVGGAMGRGHDGTHRPRLRPLGLVPGSARTDRSFQTTRVVVAFTFPDESPGNRYYWLLVEHGDAEVCYADPGDDPDVHVRAESVAFVDWHRGALSWSAARREGRITAIGPSDLVRALGQWNLHAPVAPRS